MSRRGRCGRALHQFIEALENRKLLAAGQLDPSFSGDGKQTVDFHGLLVQGNAVAVQGDGKTVVAGKASVPNQEGQSVAVVRFNFDGSLDTTFGSDHTGIVLIGPNNDSTVLNRALAVAIQGDGKIVLAGDDVDGNMAVMRLRTNGLRDRTFDGDGIANFGFGTLHPLAEAHAIAFQKDGKIIVVGQDEGFFATDIEFAVARLNTNGTLDNSFDDDGKNLIDFDHDATANAVTIDYTGTAATNPFFGGIVITGRTFTDNGGQFALDGSLVIIDWNETANTLAMFNPATGNFGAPMVMGSDNVISNNLLDMLVKTSSTKASGPTSPTVTVTFDLRFNHSAAGHHYSIEVAASNDLGAKTQFGLGGSIHVT